MTRRLRLRWFLLWPLAPALATLSLAQPSDAAETAAKGNRPNILWITCEDLSPVLGCYGDAL